VLLSEIVTISRCYQGFRGGKGMTEKSSGAWLLDSRNDTKSKGKREANGDSAYLGGGILLVTRLMRQQRAWNRRTRDRGERRRADKFFELEGPGGARHEKCRLRASGISVEERQKKTQDRPKKKEKKKKKKKKQAKEKTNGGGGGGGRGGGVRGS